MNDENLSKVDDIRRFWDVCRSHITHENDLLDHRINWLLQFHGFAFAIYAAVLALPEYNRASVLFFAFIISAVAIGATIMLQGFIFGACRAHYRWKQKWFAYKEKYLPRNDQDSNTILTEEDVSFPSPVGADNSPQVTNWWLERYAHFGSYLLRDKLEFSHGIELVLKSLVSTWCWLLVFAMLFVGGETLLSAFSEGATKTLDAVWYGLSGGLIGAAVTASGFCCLGKRPKKRDE